MPTRPMNAGTHTLRRRSTQAGASLVVDVTQGPGARAASGTFRLTQKDTGVALAMTTFGQLQTARDWASFTGRARLRPSEPERSISVIVDGDDVVVRAGEFVYTASVRR